MTEIFKKLVAQCTYQVYNSNQQLYDKFDKEKFAELIVRECMDCVSWVGKINTNEVMPANTAHTINVRIANHFEIKE